MAGFMGSPVIFTVNKDAAHTHPDHDHLFSVNVGERDSLAESNAILRRPLKIALNVSEPRTSVEQPDSVGAGHVNFHITVIVIQLDGLRQPPDCDVAVDALEPEIGVVRHPDMKIHGEPGFISKRPPQAARRIDSVEVNVVIVALNPHLNEVVIGIGPLFRPRMDDGTRHDGETRVIPSIDRDVSDPGVDRQGAIGKEPL